MLNAEKVFNSSSSQDVCSSPARLHHHRHNVKSRYEFVKTLGKGTYGKVKLARHRETNKLVAVKAIKKEKIKDSADMKHIRREIEIMSSIQHLHIIQIYEVFENEDKIVIVMEFASGGELYDYLTAKRGISNDEAKSFFRQIVSAVRYCHKHGIVHRDLKLENILLDQDNRIKIADFGLANSFKADSLLETFCGSPLYASPEIVCGIKYKGPEVDSWSLGVLLYALVYGTMPFDGRNYQILTKQITSGIVIKPPVLSEAHELICWMLTVDPRHRATIDDIAAHDWVRGSAEAPVQVKPSCTQEAVSYRQYLKTEKQESDDSNAVDHLNSSLRTSVKERSHQINQSRETLKHNDPVTVQAPPAQPLPAIPDDMEKILEGKLAAVCGPNTNSSLNVEGTPQSGSEKRRVFKSRYDRESGYYSSPEQVAPIYEKANSSDPTLHPNITPNTQVNGFLAPPGAVPYYCGQQYYPLLHQSSTPVNIPRNCYLIPTSRNERLTSVGSDDCSSTEGRTRPVSTCSDSSILSTDSFDLCTFEGCLLKPNGSTHPLVTQPVVNQPINCLSTQRPLSLHLVPDTLPPVDPTSLEEHPSGSLTPKSEKLVRDLQRILAPSGRRKRLNPNNVPNHTRSHDTPTQLSQVMNQLNVDMDLAYKKAVLDICASLKSAEV